MTAFESTSSFSLTALCLVLAAACSGKPATSGTGATPNTSVAEAAAAAEPLAVALRAVTVVGALEVSSDGATWRALTPGEQITAARGVRTSGQGAVIALGDLGDMAWLRAGTELGLARAPGDGVVLTVVSGQVRMLSVDLPTHIKTRYSTIETTGRDIVARASPTTGDTAMAYVSSEPDLARWSLALQGERRPAGVGMIDVAGMADANGTDETGDPREGRGGEAGKLELRSVNVRVESVGDYAFTEIEHVFYNPTEAQLEGTFRFPLPDDAMPLGLAMEIAGRMMEGEIVEREKARKTYESIVDAMLDPALLEWEQGNQFKLRVFPIEPMSPKRVVFRYAAPLSPTVAGWEYVYNTAAPGMQIEVPHFQLRFNGEVVADRRAFAVGEQFVVPVADRAVPRVAREILSSSPETAGTYTVARIAPDWARLGAGHDGLAANQKNGQKTAATTDDRAQRTLIALFDTSRSALEGRALALQTLEMILAELAPSDRFVVVASDITQRLHAEDFAAARPDAARAAIEFVRGIEPDGASDIGAGFERLAPLLESARRSGDSIEVVYIGDGTPTWGATEPGELGAIIDRVLRDAPLHAAIIGKGASKRFWHQIHRGRAGRVAQPRKAMDAKELAFLIAHSSATPRVEALQVEGLDDDGGATAFPRQATGLYRGQELTVVMRTPAGETPPSSLTLTGRYQGSPFRHEVAIGQPTNTRLIAQRWATLHIAELEASKAEKTAIVTMSRDFGVMSKHTSLLVLESEEAYRQHGIERKRALARNAPQVTGGDLESLGQRQASLSPDQIQPGDPEIRIPAPADARSVVVIFPFGDTKLARFDDDANAWITRFLIDKDTPDGKYLVVVKVTLADGAVQTYRLPYFVDTRAPAVTMKFKPRRRGGFWVTAGQVVSAAEMALLGEDDRPRSANAVTGWQAEVVRDAHRVELWLPDGEMLALHRKRPGRFGRVWKSGSLTEAVVLRVVVTDKALNQTTFALRVQPDGSSEVIELSEAEATDAPANAANDDRSNDASDDAIQGIAR